MPGEGDRGRGVAAVDGQSRPEADEAVRALERECEVLRAALTEYQATTSPIQDGQ